MGSVYHKIQSVYKRDPATKYATFLDGEWAVPEFGYLADNEWLWNEKVDGTNVRLVLGPGEPGSVWSNTENTLHIYGRKENSKLHAHLVARLVELVHKLPDIFAGFNHTPDTSIVVYGEGYGSGIQAAGNSYNPDGKDFCPFDVKVGSWWLERDAVADIANQLGCTHAPELRTGTIHEAVDYCKQGFDSQWGEFMAEGLILRPKLELFGRAGYRIITKIKCGDYQHEWESAR